MLKTSESVNMEFNAMPLITGHLMLIPFLQFATEYNF